MNLLDRNKLIESYHTEQLHLLATKGADYTGGRDRADGNANFKEVARRLEGAPMSPITVWMVLFEKHILSLETFVKTGRVESEGLAGRFNDVANYANIGRTLVEDSAYPIPDATKKSFCGVCNRLLASEWEKAEGQCIHCAKAGRDAETKPPLGAPSGSNLDRAGRYYIYRTGDRQCVKCRKQGGPTFECHDCWPDAPPAVYTGCTVCGMDLTVNVSKHEGICRSCKIKEV